MTALVTLGCAAAAAFGVLVRGLGAAFGALGAGQAVEAATGAGFCAVLMTIFAARLEALLVAAGVVIPLLLAVLLACARAITRAGAAAALTLRTALTLATALIELTLTAALAELAVAGLAIASVTGLAIASVTGLAVSSLVGTLFVAHASTTRPSAMSLPAPRAQAGASIIFLPAG